jgi:hypothetical protein
MTGPHGPATDSPSSASGVPRRVSRTPQGLWYCPRDIPPERIRGVVTFAALARSPVSGVAA